MTTQFSVSIFDCHKVMTMLHELTNDTNVHDEVMRTLKGDIGIL